MSIGRLIFGAAVLLSSCHICLASAPAPFSVSLALQTNETSENGKADVFSGVDLPSKKEFLYSTMLTLSASNVTSSLDRPDTNLLLVVDRSGSMHSTMGSVKDSLEFIVSQMRNGDTVGLLSYDSQFSLDCAPVNMDAAGKSRLLSAVEKLRPGGATALGDALIKGLEIMKDQASSQGTASIFMFTDGRCNSGICQQQALQARVRNARAAAEFPFSVSTFAFGADHDSFLMSGLAEEGGGSYVYISDTERIAPAFADALGGILSVVAKNVELELELGEHVQLERIHAPGMVQSSGPGKWRLRLQDLQESEQRAIPIVLRFTPIVGSPTRLGAGKAVARHILAARYRVSAGGTDSDVQFTAGVDLHVTRTPGAATPRSENPEITGEIARLRVSERIALISQALETSPAKAKEELEHLRSEVASLRLPSESPMRLKLEHLVEGLVAESEMVRDGGGRAARVATMNTIAQSLSQQRSTSLSGLGAEEASLAADFGASYQTAARMKSVQAASHFVAHKARIKNRATR